MIFKGWFEEFLVRAGESNLHPSSSFSCLCYQMTFLSDHSVAIISELIGSPLLGASISDTMFHGPVYFLDAFKSTFSRDNGNSAPSMSAF